MSVRTSHIGLAALLLAGSVYQIAHPWVTHANMMAPDVLGPVGGHHTPRREEGIAITQLDELPIPNHEVTHNDMRREFDLRRLVAMGRWANTRPLEEELMSRFNRDHIDGLWIRMGETRWGAPPELTTLITNELRLDTGTPRSAAPVNSRQFVYVSDYELTDIIGTRWQKFDVDSASSAVLEFEETRYMFTDESDQVITTLVEYTPHVGDCGDYIYCLTYIADEMERGLPFYIEQDQFYYATCVSDPQDVILLQSSSDLTVRDELGLIVVWRSETTVCYIDETQIPYQRTSAGDSLGWFFNAHLTEPPDGLSPMNF